MIYYVQVAYHVMSEGTPEENLTSIFRVFDVNSDGSISKRELQRLVKDMYGLISMDNQEKVKIKFHFYCSIIVNVLQALHRTKSSIASGAFAEMDKNEDGKVTQEEFINACLSQEEFSKLLALKIIDIFIDRK